MKKYILVVLMLVCTLAFASCGHNHMQNNVCDICSQTSCVHQQTCNNCGLMQSSCSNSCTKNSQNGAYNNKHHGNHHGKHNC